MSKTYNGSIQILNFVEGARQATGLAVIIDVFRAFSLACYLVANGADRILPVAEIETALALHGEYPQAILIGERKGRKLPGFDYNNSPAEIEGVDLSGKTIIHTTSNGTQGLVNAQAADEVITGSFVNAGAIVAYIQARQPEIVSLVCMGSSPGNIAEEDVLCAEYLQATLQGNPPDFAAIKRGCRYSKTGVKFFDPAETWAPEPDFELCLARNRFDFVLRVQPFTEEQLVLHRLVFRGVNKATVI